MNNKFDKKHPNLIALQIEVIYSMVNCQGSYYSVSYGPTALKICHDTVHQKVAEQHIDKTNVTLTVMKKNIIYSFWLWLKIASLGRQQPQPTGTAKWPTTLRFGKILEQLLLYEV